MIVRHHQNQLLLITQPDHAALAADVMAEWQSDGLRQHPRRHLILLATREHDAGWIEADAEPLVDEASSHLLDFVHAPDAIRQGVWPIAVERLCDDPFAAALVAQHAITVYDGYRPLPGWADFFHRMEDLRARFLAAAAPRRLEELVSDYRFVLLGDRVSLTFATGRSEPWTIGTHELRGEEDRLTIRPDPFNGGMVQLRLSGRLMSDVPYLHQADAAAAFRAAPVATLTAMAAGA